MGITGIGGIHVTQSIGQRRACGVSEIFVSLHNFLTSAAATSASVQVVATNFGISGSGFNYHDFPTGAISNNAWAVYKFASASIPFYMHMQVAWGSGTTGERVFGQDVGAPASLPLGDLDSIRTYGGLGFQFAMRADGSNPWTGTTASSGFDTKGNPVWSSGSLVFPYCNTTASAKDKHIMGVNQGPLQSIVGNAMKCNMVIDENNVALFSNLYLSGATPTGTGSYFGFWFGKYDPYVSCSVPGYEINPTVPYAMFNTYPMRSTFGGGLPISINWEVYGSDTGDSEFEGGIVHPEHSIGVVPLQLHCLTCLASGTIWPNRAYTGTQNYDEFPITLAMCSMSTSRSDLHFGVLGETSFVRLVPTIMLSGDYFDGGSPSTNRAVLGSTPVAVRTVSSSLGIKWSIPWATSSVLNATVLLGTTGSLVHEVTNVHLLRTGTIF